MTRQTVVPKPLFSSIHPHNTTSPAICRATVTTVDLSGCFAAFLTRTRRGGRGRFIPVRRAYPLTSPFIATSHRRATVTVTIPLSTPLCCLGKGLLLLRTVTSGGQAARSAGAHGDRPLLGVSCASMTLRQLHVAYLVSPLGPGSPTAGLAE